MPDTREELIRLAERLARIVDPPPMMGRTEWVRNFDIPDPMTWSDAIDVDCWERQGRVHGGTSS